MDRFPLQKMRITECNGRWQEGVIVIIVLLVTYLSTYLLTVYFLTAIGFWKSVQSLPIRRESPSGPISVTPLQPDHLPALLTYCLLSYCHWLLEIGPISPYKKRVSVRTDFRYTVAARSSACATYLLSSFLLPLASGNRSNLSL